MTTNERLFTAGLLESFDEAVNTKDLDAMLDILAKVEMGGEVGRKTALSILASPERYGYPRPKD